MALKMIQCGAGMATSAAIAMARVGAEASMCSMIGDDVAGHKYLEDLASESVVGCCTVPLPRPLHHCTNAEYTSQH